MACDAADREGGGQSGRRWCSPTRTRRDKGLQNALIAVRGIGLFGCVMACFLPRGKARKTTEAEAAAAATADAAAKVSGAAPRLQCGDAGTLRSEGRPAQTRAGRPSRTSGRRAGVSFGHRRRGCLRRLAVPFGQLA